MRGPEFDSRVLHVWWTKCYWDGFSSENFVFSWSGVT